MIYARFTSGQMYLSRAPSKISLLTPRTHLAQDTSPRTYPLTHLTPPIPSIAILTSPILHIPPTPPPSPQIAFAPRPIPPPPPHPQLLHPPLTRTPIPHPPIKNPPLRPTRIPSFAHFILAVLTQHNHDHDNALPTRTTSSTYQLHLHLHLTTNPHPQPLTPPPTMLTRLLLTLTNIFFPPLAVLLLTGPYTDTLLNCIFFLLGVLPSHIHGFYISCTYFHRKLLR